MIVGTAGHIDHGKTALVRALTGVDADRLAEEKARGITIELGFAYADLGAGRPTGFVDVPGHERFVHTMLAGAGLHQLGETYTVARDLHDLAQTLESLGGVPPILALLRDAPDTLTARDALDLLGYDSPASGSAAASARTPGPAGVTGLGAPSLPSLHPMSLLDSSAPLPQSGSYLWQASWTDPRQTQFGELQPAPAATVSSTQGEGQHAGESFQLDISQWDFPDFLEHPAAEHGPKAAPPTPVVITTAPAVLQWATPNRPVTAPDREATAQAAEDAGRPVQVAAAPQPSALAAMPAAPSPSPAAVSNPATGPRRKAKAAALRAVERLRADANRQQSLAEARRDHVPAQWPAVAQGAEQEQGAASAPRETPQERRRREQAALQEQAEFDARAAAERKARAASEQVQTPQAGLTPSAANLTPDSDLPTVSRRQLKPIRATWTADGRWQVLHDDAAAPSRPLWLWPAVAVGAALLLLLLVLGLGRRAAPAVATACCDVQFAVQGAGQSASLSVDEAPAASGLTLGESLGTVPGRVHFPAQGRYVVRVSAEGFTPARLALDVPPKEQPVNINLGQ